ncbi:hypothetical protein OESDEN_14678, partial [Oesophagostomum dentatum]
LRPVASGNWGCGVFGGNKELKSLIQIIAAAKARRGLIYCTFHDKPFETSLVEQYEKLLEMGATIGEVYRALTSFHKQLEREPKLSVFQHVSNCLAAFRA